MQLTENQRFTEVIIYLQNNNYIRFEKDIAQILNVNKDRIKYLKKRRVARCLVMRYVFCGKNSLKSIGFG